MARYSYRTLRVRVWDKWDGRRGYTVGLADPGRRRGGDKPDRILVLEDSGPPRTESQHTDQMGDDLPAFMERTKPAVLEYLNRLGEDGWQVIHCAVSDDLCGMFLLMRTV